MSERAGGEKPTFDPKDQVKGVEARKKGDWYTIEGHVRGEKVRVDIPANEVESRKRGDAEALMRRSLLGTANEERDRGRR